MSVRRSVHRRPSLLLAPVLSSVVVRPSLARAAVMAAVRRRGPRTISPALAAPPALLRRSRPRWVHRTLSHPGAVLRSMGRAVGPTREPSRLQRRVGNNGIVTVVGQKVALGRSHARQTVTVNFAEHSDGRATRWSRPNRRAQHADAGQEPTKPTDAAESPMKRVLRTTRVGMKVERRPPEYESSEVQLTESV